MTLALVKSINVDLITPGAIHALKLLAVVDACLDFGIFFQVENISELQFFRSWPLQYTKLPYRFHVV